MFKAADLVLITKMDLLPHLDFDLEEAKSSVAQIAPDAHVIEVSTKSGQGLEQWYGWIRAAKKQAAT
jgi:hydrogenase nickel incorporation protein HypB